MKTHYEVVFLALCSLLSWYALAGFRLGVYVSVILALFAFQIFLNGALESYLTRRLASKYFSFLIAPGTVAHELSHAFTAKLLGCNITRISLFSRNALRGTLGFVEYTQKKDAAQAIRTVLIAFSPFIGCGILIIAVLNYLALSQTGLEVIGPSISTAGGAEELMAFFAALLERILSQPLTYDLASPVVVVLLYLQFAFALGVAPSQKDLSDAFGSLMKHKLQAAAILAFVLCIIAFPDYSEGFGEYAEPASELIFIGFSWILLILLVSSAMLLVSIPLSALLTETLSLPGLYKLLPFLLFFAVYFLLLNVADISQNYSALAAFAVFLAALLFSKTASGRKEEIRAKGRRSA